MARDPLLVTRAQLEAMGVPSDEIDGWSSQAKQDVAEAVAEARAAPEPDPATALTDLWADGSAGWRT